MLEKAIAIIKEFEGFYPNAYPDPRTGGKPITIGYGSTRRANGEEWQLGDRVTQVEADKLLREQLQRDYLPPLQRIPCWDSLNCNQQAALLSFAYNLGASFYGTPGFDTITRCLHDKNFTNISSAFSLYCNPGSSVEAGLRRRREAEARLFLAEDNGSSRHTATPAMSSTPAVFRICRQTFLKKLPHSAKDLPVNQRIDVPEGAFIKALEFEAIGKHYRVVVANQKVPWEQSGLTRVLQIPAGEWYLYGTPLSPDPHVELFVSGVAIEQAKVLSVAATTVPFPESPPLATFTMELPSKSTRSLISGTFDLVGTAQPRSFTCTSGQPAYQYTGSTHLKGKAPLPSCKELGIDNYWILTEELVRFQTKGIQGYAFHILPDPVQVRGVTRGEFMVHNDTNRAVAPGSSGCIVFLFDNGWNIWRNCMKEFRDRNISKIPLKVVY